MYFRTPESITESNEAGLELLDAFRQFKIAELEAVEGEDSPYAWNRAHSVISDAIYDVHEREITISRLPDANPYTITKFKLPLLGGEKVLGPVEQVNGYISFDYEAVELGRLALHRVLPWPLARTDIEPRLNVNFRRQYRINPFRQETGLDDMRPAINIVVR